MPYIKKEDRTNLQKIANDLCFELDELSNGTDFRHKAGNLNFFISTVVDRILSDNRSYARINELIGALECAKLEIYRKLAAPYEDQKAVYNGEVFTPFNQI